MLSVSFGIHAQEKKYKLKIVSVSSSETENKREKQKIRPEMDSLQVVRELQSTLHESFNEGRLAARYDSIIYRRDSVIAFIEKGVQYHWGSFCLEKPDEQLSKKLNNVLIKTGKKAISYSEISRSVNDLLTYYENSGYPFASVRLINVSFSEDSVHAEIHIEKQDRFIIDSIEIKGKARISGNYISHILGISQGDIYQEQSITSISKRISDCRILRETRPHETEFHTGKARLFLYLENRKSNQFDGILGIAPDNKNTGKLTLTGNVNLLLANTFGKGESFTFNWQKTGQYSQQLKTSLSWPYLYSTPFGAEAGIDLFKKDTTYLIVKLSTGLQYFFGLDNFTRITYSHESSSLVSTYGLQNESTLPQYADITANMAGFGMQVTQTDYRMNPRKGFVLLADASVGIRNIMKNSKINDAAYQGIKLNSKIVRCQSEFCYYLPLISDFVFKYRNTSGIISNSQLFENELYRLGGLKSVRGFDEESILASSYFCNNAEIRYLFEENSAVFLFFDKMFYRKDLISTSVTDQPYGFGLGVDFETRTGIIAIDYALGSQFGNPVELRAARMHIGFISKF
ncbi:MAG: BamA/TamA family outer membrane protein [Bacteroidia bacterium]|nr:BamA/TamA family outer membrane protein [Bacteroidia bacterium]